MPQRDKPTSKHFLQRKLLIIRNKNIFGYNCQIDNNFPDKPL